MHNNASLGQVYDSMQEAYQQMQSPLIYQEPSTRVLIYNDSFTLTLFNPFFIPRNPQTLMLVVK